MEKVESKEQKRPIIARELWFRRTYRTLIQQKKLRLTLREGNRRYPHPKGMREGEIAKIRILLMPGNEKRGIAPIFDSFETKVRIQKILVKKLGALTPNELKNCSPDCKNKELAKYELGLIYNREFSDDDIVSVIYFDYVD